MNNNVLTKKRIALVAVGCVLGLASLTGGALLAHAQAANASTSVEARPTPDSIQSSHLATASVPIAIGGEATALSGTFKNDKSIPLAVAVIASDLDTSAFTDGDLNATRVLVTVGAGLESVTVETSLREFASEDTMRSEQMGVSTMEVDPGEVVSYSVLITPPASSDPKFDNDPFSASITLTSIFEVRNSQEVSS